jgi:hypothetical protein
VSSKWVTEITAFTCILTLEIVTTNLPSKMAPQFAMWCCLTTLICCFKCLFLWETRDGSFHGYSLFLEKRKSTVTGNNCNRDKIPTVFNYLLHCNPHNYIWSFYGQHSLLGTWILLKLHAILFYVNIMYLKGKANFILDIKNGTHFTMCTTNTSVWWITRRLC